MNTPARDLGLHGSEMLALGRRDALLDARRRSGPRPEPRPLLLRHASLSRYLEGWAEADPARIAAAAAPDYRFHDPLVGTFTRHSLSEYFALLRVRLSRSGVIRRQDTAFFLGGPLDLPFSPGALCFWREAPRLGLTGTAQITLAGGGVAADCVAYDLNLAADLLRRRKPPAVTV